MTITLGFKDIIDLPEWRPLSPAIVVAGAGVSLAYDLRNSEVRDPYVYMLGAAAGFYKYHIKNDEWLTLLTPGLGGTFAAGAGCIFVPSGGPSGTISAGSTTQITIGTALPAAVGTNQLANCGDGIGYKIRIMGKSAGGSGLTEERTIIANTLGTQPIIYVDVPFSFTPQNTDGYELLSGSVIMFSAGALAATIIRKFDVATQFYSSVTNTNYIATIATDMTLFAMDELYVPATRAPGDGFFGSLISTGKGASTITGQAALGDATVAVNEFRNFQIRITKDVTNPAAVGQRRKIVSHTVGTSPIYTLKSAWTTQPTVGATYVIEYNNDILSWNGTTTVTYSYAAGFAADAAWSTAAVDGGSANQYANPSGAHAAGAMVFPSFGITLDTNKLARYSYFYYFRGGGLVTVDLFDIAGAATGAWTAAIAIGGQGTLPTTGSAGVYDGSTNLGKYGYMSVSGTQRFARFDVLNRVLEPWAYLRYPQGTATAGEKCAFSLVIDGTTKVGFLYTIIHAGAPLLSCLLQR